VEFPAKKECDPPPLKKKQKGFGFRSGFYKYCAPLGLGRIGNGCQMVCRAAELVLPI
jgi:hypothetical protein